MEPAALRPRKKARTTGFDPHRILANIADDSSASAAHRLRAVRLLLQAQPNRRRREPEPGSDPVMCRAIQIVQAWAAESGAIPTGEAHRGVPLHLFQSGERTDIVVRPGLDRVLHTFDPSTLFAIASNIQEPPECRLLAHAMYKALAEVRSAAHDARLGGLELIAARTTGLSALRWADPANYASLLDTWQPGSVGAAVRPPDFARQLETACQRDAHS